MTTKGSHDNLIRRLVANVKLFAHFSPQDVSDFLAHAHKKAARPNERIIVEGETGRTFYVIISGSADVLCRGTGYEERRLAVLEPGDAFGEMALLEHMPRSASVIARELSLLLEFHSGDLMQVPQLAPKIYRNMACMLAERLRQTNATISLIMDEQTQTMASARLHVVGNPSVLYRG